MILKAWPPSPPFPPSTAILLPPTHLLLLVSLPPSTPSRSGKLSSRVRENFYMKFYPTPVLIFKTVAASSHRTSLNILYLTLLFLPTTERINFGSPSHHPHPFIKGNSFLLSSVKYFIKPWKRSEFFFVK